MPRSGSRSQAASTASRFSSGSPIPMNTQWSTRSRRRKCSAWSRISEGVRLRANLIAPGGAEGAGQRAARLRGEADRAPPVSIAHQHRLQRPPVGGGEQRLHRAVAARHLAAHLQARERHLPRELLAQRPRQVGHRLIPRRARGRPPPHLGGAEARLARSARVSSQKLLRSISLSLQPMRLAKHLAHAGVASRRAAETLIVAGRVRVDGELVRDPARDVGRARPH